MYVDGLFRINRNKIYYFALGAFKRHLFITGCNELTGPHRPNGYFRPIVAVAVSTKLF